MQVNNRHAPAVSVCGRRHQYKCQLRYSRLIGAALGGPGRKAWIWALQNYRRAFWYILGLERTENVDTLIARSWSNVCQQARPLGPDRR